MALFDNLVIIIEPANHEQFVPKKIEVSYLLVEQTYTLK
jgi:hypothetical protein